MEIILFFSYNTFKIKNILLIFKYLIKNNSNVRYNILLYHNYNILFLDPGKNV